MSALTLIILRTYRPLRIVSLDIRHASPTAEREDCSSASRAGRVRSHRKPKES